MMTDTLWLLLIPACVYVIMAILLVIVMHLCLKDIKGSQEEKPGKKGKDEDMR